MAASSFAIIIVLALAVHVDGFHKLIPRKATKKPKYPRIPGGIPEDREWDPVWIHGHDHPGGAFRDGLKMDYFGKEERSEYLPAMWNGVGNINKDVQKAWKVGKYVYSTDNLKDAVNRILLPYFPERTVPVYDTKDVEGGKQSQVSVSALAGVFRNFTFPDLRPRYVTKRRYDGSVFKVYPRDTISTTGYSQAQIWYLLNHKNDTHKRQEKILLTHDKGDGVMHNLFQERFKDPIAGEICETEAEAKETAATAAIKAILGIELYQAILEQEWICIPPDHYTEPAFDPPWMTEFRRIGAELGVDKFRWGNTSWSAKTEQWEARKREDDEMRAKGDFHIIVPNPHMGGKSSKNSRKKALRIAEDRDGLDRYGYGPPSDYKHKGMANLGWKSWPILISQHIVSIPATALISVVMGGALTALRVCYCRKTAGEEQLLTSY